MKMLRQLRKEKGLSMKELGAIIGLAESTISQYETGKREPDFETLLKLGEFFGVSVDYLLRGDYYEKQPAENDRLTERDRKDIAKDLERLRQDLESADTLMFDGDPMTDEARESILAAMKLGLEAAKIKNKEKYTPKKYKKD